MTCDGSSLQIGEGDFRYRWTEEWAALPRNQKTRENGRTHGVAVTRDQQVVVFAQTAPAVLFFDNKGQLVRSWGDRFPGAHGLTLIEEEGEERLWLTDHDTGEVSKTTLDGELLMTIEAPSVRSDEFYKPTWAAVAPESSDIYVADGYGTNVIRIYDKNGHYQGELTGEEGPGRFARPHGIAFSTKGELWITDRRRKRVLVYDNRGNCLRYRDGLTHSPCSFAFDHSLVFVPELFGSLKVLTAGLELVAELGANTEVRPPGGWKDKEAWGWPELEGWPDLKGTTKVQAGRFISPHDVAVASNGDLYVVEWIVGGRITRLAKI